MTKRVIRSGPDPRAPERAAWEQQCYGCSSTDLDAMEGGMMEGKMLIGSILSDVQEAMENGQHELARQFLNRAKYFLFK
jgi:hypothetical protein